MLERGVRVPDVAKALGIKEYPAKKLAAQAERFSIEELRDATVRIARLDHALKGGASSRPTRGPDSRWPTSTREAPLKPS